MRPGGTVREFLGIGRCRSVTNGARVFSPIRSGSFFIAIASGVLAIASLLTPQIAMAACAPAAGAGTPASGTTVTCSGTTTNQNSPNGYGDGSQNGLTINVQGGATVTSNIQNGAGIDVNTGNTINNSGTISATGAPNPPFATTNFGISATGTATVVNNSTGTISGNSGSIFVNGDLSLNNMGTVLGFASANGTFTLTNSGNTNELGSNTQINLTNTGNVIGTGSGNSVIGAPAGTINNSGLIDSPVATTGFGTIAILGKNQTFTITNSGTISFSQATRNGSSGDAIGGTSDSLGDGSGNVITITNTASGKITSAASRAMFAISTTDNTGNKFNGNTFNITNAGTISSNAGVFAIVNVGQNAVTNVVNSGTITGGGGIFTQNFTSTQFVPTLLTSGSSSVFNSGTITGTGGTAITFGGSANTLTLAPTSIINGNVVGSGTDIFQLGGTGTGTFDVSLLGAGVQYSGFTTFNKLAGSNWTVTGNSTFAGATNVNGGILSVNGSLANSTVTVNAGGTLGGNGTVGNTVINGGTLAPGNSIGLLTVQGNLVFTAASSYMVEVSPANADRTNVTGTATLGGATVSASFAAGTYVTKQYTIVNATGGVIGTFNGPVNTNLPGGFKSSLSYDGNNAYLNLVLNLTPGTPTGPNFAAGLNVNQQNVANALTNFFNSTGGIPIVFGALTPAGLTQASGELPTAAQQTTFDAMNLFMGLLTDPFIAGRGDPVNAGASAPQFADDNGAASAYAANGKPRTNSERDAYAAIYRKAPVLADPFTQRWSVWAAGYGGSQTTDGNTALGSNNTRSSIGGVAVGADYRFSPNTLAGFAIAGGGTNFNVNGLGSGRSDLFQAGAFIRHNNGPAYITAALAYGWQNITTDRTVTIAGTDLLHANFNANAYSGRVEGGYRFVTPWLGGIGITPYAAGQFTTFDLPAYAEQVLAGAGTFALSYMAKSVTDTRSELGIRSDKSFAMQNGIFTLRGRAAWAHDFDPDRNIGATFQTLPGASFVVNGATHAADSALVTGSAEMKWLNGFSLAGIFEGEFSNVTRSYAGKGVARYSW
jgi:uncharacterized protein with beta-barrel porin domain